MAGNYNKTSSNSIYGFDSIRLSKEIAIKRINYGEINNKKLNLAFNKLEECSDNEIIIYNKYFNNRKFKINNPNGKISLEIFCFNSKAYMSVLFSSKIFDPTKPITDLKETVEILNREIQPYVLGKISILDFDIKRLDVVKDVKIDFDFDSIKKYFSNFHVNYKSDYLYSSKELETSLSVNKSESLSIYDKTKELKKMQNILIEDNILRIEYQRKKNIKGLYETAASFGDLIATQKCVIKRFKIKLNEIYESNIHNLYKPIDNFYNKIRNVSDERTKNAIKNTKKVLSKGLENYVANKDSDFKCSVRNYEKNKIKKYSEFFVIDSLLQRKIEYIFLK